MKLSEEIKAEIIAENEAFYNKQYGNMTKEQRKKLGAVYTPGDLVIMLIEQYDCETLSGNILDPTCGSGNLLMGALIASQGECTVYGNELNEEMVKLCRARIKKYCEAKGWKKQWYYHIHRGNALDARCLSDFSEKGYRAYEQAHKAEWDAMC